MSNSKTTGSTGSGQAVVTRPAPRSNPKADTRPSVDMTGIYTHAGTGWRARVTRGRGMPPLERCFPAGTPIREMQEWRADEKAKARLTRKRRATMGTFEADAKRYLELVASLPTIEDRKREIRLWVEEFGTTRRDTITAQMIRAVRERWIMAPRGKAKGLVRGTKAQTQAARKPIAAGTINKRLRALSNVWHVLDGPRCQNPVREVPEVREPDPQDRSLDYGVIVQILSCMPDTGRAEKDGDVPTVSKSKIRAHCLAFCPMTSKQLQALTPADLDLVNARVHLPTRLKGQGAASTWTTLVPQAVAAFTAFDAHDCYGAFSRSSLLKAWRKAIKRSGLDVKNDRIYDLRHSFATMAHRELGSLEAVGALLQHGSKKTTARYAIGAQAAVLDGYGARLSLHFSTTLGSDNAGTLGFSGAGSSGKPGPGPRLVKKASA